MTNQWGRSGVSAGRRPGSLVVMSMAVLVSVVIGLGAGYGLARYAATPDRDAKAALQQERDRLAEQVQRQSAELDELTLKLMARDGDTAKREASTDAGLRKVQDDLAKANEARQHAESENARLVEARDQAETKVGDLSRQLETARQDGSEALRAAEAARRQVDALKAERDATRARLESNANEAGRASEREIARLREALSVEKDRVADLTAALDSARRDLAGQQSAQDVSRRDVDITQNELSKTRDENARLRAQVDRLSAAQTAGTEATAPPLKPDAQPSQTARDEQAVEAVLSRTPGLGGLTSGQRDTLKSQLVDGACVSKALGNAFGRVPLVTMRDLMRDLQSGC